MARWKLIQSHYLHVEGTKWEYTEVDRITGRPKRTQFPVPAFLDINDPTCWTNRLSPDEGEIVVTNGKGTFEPRDIVFKGNPTPDMEPVDDEAKDISASFTDLWRRGADAMVSGKSYTEEIMDSLHAQMGELQKVQQKPAEVQVPGLSDALQIMAEVMKQNQQMMAEIAKASGRRL